MYNPGNRAVRRQVPQSANLHYCIPEAGHAHSRVGTLRVQIMSMTRSGCSLTRSRNATPHSSATSGRLGSFSVQLITRAQQSVG